MARPQKHRIVEAPPAQYSFFSEGKNGSDLQVKITLDEFEAVRLADYLNLSHGESAEIMGVSRPTFTRLLEKAHKKISCFIIEGKQMEIQGGRIRFTTNVFCCRQCHRPFVWDGDDTPVCPDCSGKDTIVAHSSCDGSCACCESRAAEK